MASITFDSVGKKYPNGFVALESLNLDIADKEFLVLLGPSGCGKSTTLNMIAGLEDVTDGNLFFDKDVMNTVPPHKRDVAMVFQSYALYPHKTVYDNIAFGLRMRKHPRNEIDRRVRDAARRLEIEPLLDRRPDQLSGGQRQRVALGRAMVRQPAVFLIDEPPRNMFVASFLGNPPINFLEGRLALQDERIVFQRGQLNLTLPGPLAERVGGQLGREVVLGIRAEDVSQVPPSAASDGVQGRIVSVLPVGSDQFFEMEVEGTRLFFRLGKEVQHREGDNAALAVNLNRLHLFDKQTTQSLVWH